MSTAHITPPQCTHIPQVKRPPQLPLQSQYLERPAWWPLERVCTHRSNLATQGTITITRFMPAILPLYDGHTFFSLSLMLLTSASL